MDLPAGVRLIRQGKDQLKVAGLAALPRDEAARVVRIVKQHKSKLLKDIESAEVPAKEFIELARRGEVGLHTDGEGGLWWSADLQDTRRIQKLWLRAYRGLFQMLYQGELKEILQVSNKSKR